MIEPMATDPYDLSAKNMLAKFNEIIETLNTLEDLFVKHYHDQGVPGGVTSLYRKQRQKTAPATGE